MPAAPLAQLVEQRTLNPLVVGSSPTWRTPPFPPASPRNRPRTAPKPLVQTPAKNRKNRTHRRIRNRIRWEPSSPGRPPPPESRSFGTGQVMAGQVSGSPTRGVTGSPWRTPRGGYAQGLGPPCGRDGQGRGPLPPGGITLTDGRGDTEVIPK